MSQHVQDKPYSKDMIRAEIASLKRGDRLPWGSKARLLLEIERSGYFKDESKFFTAWMKENLDLFRVKRASLWRFRSAGQYYEELRPDFPELDLPPLEEVSSEVGPEKLELLAKISRVAPEDTFRPLAVKVLTGQATRPELISAWNSFKPALEGQTARGRGVEPPKAREPSERVRGAVVASALSNLPPTWTGAEDIVFHRVFLEVCDSIRPEFIRYDAVIVVKSRQAPLAFHGIEIKDEITPLVIQRLKTRMKKCDFMWLVLAARPSREDLEKLPETAGVLLVDSSGIVVVRPARTNPDGVDTEWMSRQLLERAVE